MNQKPLVSVICTCYNHQNFVTDSIQSVLNQTYSNIEIIIIDDYSLDDSVTVIKNFIIDFPEIKFIENPENLGNTKAFNKAEKLATGDFLIDLAGDDLLLKNCIEDQVNTFLSTENKSVGIVFGNTLNINANGDYVSDYFKTNLNKNVVDQGLFKTDLKRILKGGLCMNSVSSMMNKKIFNELNGYDESLAYEDLDYWLRVLDNHKIIFIDKFLTQKRNLSTSLGSQFYRKSKFSNKMDLSTLKIYKKVLKKHKSNKTILKALLKRIHHSMEQSFKNKKMSVFLRFFQIKILTNLYILVAK